MVAILFAYAVWPYNRNETYAGDNCRLIFRTYKCATQEKLHRITYAWLKKIL